jgi:hypothetical protein
MDVAYWQILLQKSAMTSWAAGARFFGQEGASR